LPGSSQFEIVGAMETTQPNSASKSTARRSSQKPSTVPPKPSAKAKRAAAAASGKRQRAKTAAKRLAGSQTESPEQRSHRIAVAAYFLAEQRGFAPNRELEDWLAAERSL
jgi:hypothetical protein